MKIILAGTITLLVVLALLVKRLRKYKWGIMGAYLVGVIALFAFYNYRTLDLILPFYHSSNQLFYQKEFVEAGEYPDSLLPYIFEGKNVYLPNYIYWNEDTIDSYDAWNNGEILCMNIEKILTSSGANVIYSECGDKIKDEQKQLFEDLGYLNDTFRYSFFYNNLESEYGNAFYYYWYYGANSAPIKMYVCAHDLESAEDLMILFDKEMGFYLIAKDYYEKEVAGL